jgi:erythromycin esterase-like protein
MFSCPGCKAQFETSRASGNHRRACNAFKSAPASIFAQRDRDLAALQQAEGRRRAQEQAMEADLARREVEMAEDVHAEVSAPPSSTLDRIITTYPAYD